mmetsp:Transcript_61600/g.177316  ORF Transcript_61600/g.177316 Transcript_61600/m.177316 type:complete len:227 (+) Transcript_61600:1405-2085(+)
MLGTVVRRRLALRPLCVVSDRLRRVGAHRCSFVCRQRLCDAVRWRALHLGLRDMASCEACLPAVLCDRGAARRAVAHRLLGDLGVAHRTRRRRERCGGVAVACRPPDNRGSRASAALVVASGCLHGSGRVEPPHAWDLSSAVNGHYRRVSGVLGRRRQNRLDAVQRLARCPRRPLLLECHRGMGVVVVVFRYPHCERKPLLDGRIVAVQPQPGARKGGISTIRLGG